MKRYIKVKGRWLDTLESLKAGYCYLKIGKIIYEIYSDTKLGYLQAESDINPLKYKKHLVNN